MHELTGHPLTGAAVIPGAGKRPSQRRSPLLQGRSASLTLSVEVLLVGVISLLCAAWALQLWRADLTVPLRYSPVDDTKFYLALVKGVIEHGWYLSNPSLGAPFGQQLLAYPQGADNLNLLIIRGLAVFSSNPALVVNLFLLSTFALTSMTCHLALRALGVGAPGAAVSSVLFSLLPYHFFRGESHLLLSAYYSVPLTGYLFLRLLGSDPLYSRRPEARRRIPAWASPRSLTTVAMCVVIASDNLYYAIFALVLIVAATTSGLARRRRRAAREGLTVVALIAGVLAVNLAPSLIYRAEHGADPAIERTAVADESSNEALALRPANLVLPAPASRIGPLRSIATRYDNAIAPGYCEACYGSVGAVGTVGFAWLFACALGGLLGALWVRRRPLLAHASVGMVIALAFGTVGGLGALVEVFVSPDIRAWNRMSVVIAFFSLLAAALILNSIVERVQRRPGGTALATTLLAGVLVLGVYEQTSGQYVPAYSATEREWHSDSRFVAEIEARLPRGASVFQLPYVPFPEGYPQTPVGGPLATYATKYEPLRGYLHSSTLRWSYGAMKGTSADWPAHLTTQPLSLVIAAVAAAGFEGVWVDPAGFSSQKRNRVRSSLRSMLGVAPLVSPDGDLWFYDLRPYLTTLERTHTAGQIRALRARTLHAPITSCPSRQSSPPRSGGAAGRTRTPADSLIVGLTGPPCPH